MHRKPVFAREADRAAQAIEGQALGEIVDGLPLAIDQQVVLVAPDQEIEQHLPLRRQQPRPHRQVARHVVGDESLQESGDILARQADKGTIVEGGIGHGDNRSEEHTSELQSLMRISYAVFCLKKKQTITPKTIITYL